MVNCVHGLSSDSPLTGLKCLKELSLTGVAFYNSDLRLLLSELVTLERLRIESSTLKPYYFMQNDECLCRDLDIEGSPASRLKHLIISNVLRYCTRVTHLMSLVSLRCDGMRSFDGYIHLHDLPKFVHLRVGIAEDQIFAGGYPDVLCDKSVRVRCLEVFTELRSYEVTVDKMITVKDEHIFDSKDERRDIPVRYELHFTRHYQKHLELNVVVDMMRPGPALMK